MPQENVLLVGSTEKSRALLQTLLPPDQFTDAKICVSGSEARRSAMTATYDLVVINTPLSDESGLDLALEFSRQSTTAVMLLVKADLAETVATRMEEYGVMVLAKPVAKPLFDQALRFSRMSHGRMVALQKENEQLEKKLAELKLVDRAKCVLIQYLGMSEEQAHRHIEKQAMDSRQTKAAVARAILATYEM